jgi:hypothetical protein
MYGVANLQSSRYKVVDFVSDENLGTFLHCKRARKRSFHKVDVIHETHV